MYPKTNWELSSSKMSFFHNMLPKRHGFIGMCKALTWWFPVCYLGVIVCGHGNNNAGSCEWPVEYQPHSHPRLITAPHIPSDHCTIEIQADTFL